MNKKDLVVLGLDEVKHQRIMKTIGKIRDFISNFDTNVELIPLLEQDNMEIKKFLEAQIELGDFVEPVRDFLQAELDEIETVKSEYIQKQKNYVDLNKDRRDRLEGYLNIFTRYIKINEDGTQVEYLNSDVTDVLIALIDTFDLDGKMADEKSKEIGKEQTKK